MEPLSGKVINDENDELAALNARTNNPEETVKCRLTHEETLSPGELCGLELSIEHVGRPLITSKVDSCITVESTIKSVKPKSGSIYGGQVVDIRGEALNTGEYLEDYQVSFGKMDAMVVAVDYNKISVRVPPPSGEEDDGFANIIVKILGVQVESLTGVQYRYDPDRTPMIHSVDRTDNKMVINGVGFIGDMVVAVGDYQCQNAEFTANQIKCTAEQVPAGFYYPRVLSSTYGLAGVADKEASLISLPPMVDSLRPNVGSVKGGNLLTIRVRPLQLLFES